MESKKVIGVITSKEYQELSNNYKFKITTLGKQELFFYSQQKHQRQSQELEVIKDCHRATEPQREELRLKKDRPERLSVLLFQFSPVSVPLWQNMAN